MDRSDARRGGRSTRRVSSRNGAGAFSWCTAGLEVGEIPLECFSRPKPRVSSILQRAGVEERHFLTPKACAGIAERAARRGKRLPDLLERALHAAASSVPDAWGESAMTSNGRARAADEMEATRGLDTTGGFAANQGRNLALNAAIKEALAEDPLVFDNNQVTSVLNYSNPKPGDPVHPLTHFGQPPLVALPERVSDGGGGEDVQAPLDEAVYQEGELGVSRYETAGTLRAGRIPEHQQIVMPPRRRMRVRRLTPLECLRLQGFPDGYLAAVRLYGKPLPDGAVYRMTGNSWAVPVAGWLFRRLDAAARDSCREVVGSE